MISQNKFEMAVLFFGYLVWAQAKGIGSQLADLCQAKRAMAEFALRALIVGLLRMGHLPIKHQFTNILEKALKDFWPTILKTIFFDFW